MMPNAPLSRACLAEATGLSAIPLRWQRQWWLCCTGSRCSRSWAQPQLTRLRGFAVTWFAFLPRWPKTRKNVKKNSSGKIRKDPLTRKYRGKVPTQMDDFKQKSRQCQSQRQATSLPPSLSSARSSVHSASCHLPSAVSITLTCVCCTQQRQRNVCKHRWIVKGNYVNWCKRVNIPPACLSSRSTFQPRSCWATEKEPITDAYVI